MTTDSSPIEMTLRRDLALRYAAGWLALAVLPVVVLAGVPFAAWLLAVALWLANVASHSAVRWVAGAADNSAVLGLAAFSLFARTWGTAAVLLFVGVSVTVGEASVGLGEPETALAGLLIYIVLFTIDIAMRIAADNRARAAAVASQEARA